MCVGISPRVSFKAVSACFSIDIFTSLHYFSLIHSSAVKKKDLFQYLTLKHSKSHMANKMKKSVYMYHASTQDCEWIFSCSQDRCRYNKWSTMLNKDKHSDMWLLCREKQVWMDIWYMCHIHEKGYADSLIDERVCGSVRHSNIVTCLNDHMMLSNCRMISQLQSVQGLCHEHIFESRTYNIFLSLQQKNTKEKKIRIFGYIKVFS